MIIYVKPPFIKLDSLIKLSGIASTGGQAKVIVENGKVILNGEVCTVRGKKIIDGDVVKCSGQTIEVKFKV